MPAIQSTLRRSQCGQLKAAGIPDEPLKRCAKPDKENGGTPCSSESLGGAEPNRGPTPIRASDTKRSWGPCEWPGSKLQCGFGLDRVCPCNRVPFGTICDYSISGSGDKAGTSFRIVCVKENAPFDVHVGFCANDWPGRRRSIRCCTKPNSIVCAALSPGTV